jgi:formylmethanofuran dehydrogenase subunit C
LVGAAISAALVRGEGADQQGREVAYGVVVVSGPDARRFVGTRRDDGFAVGRKGSRAYAARMLPEPP